MATRAFTGHPLAGLTGVFERNGHEFSTDDDYRDLVDQTGTTWTKGDDRLTAEDGSTLLRIHSRENILVRQGSLFFHGAEVYGE